MLWSISEQLLSTGVTFSSNLASESHWMWPVLVETVHWWPALESAGGLLVQESNLDIGLPTHLLIKVPALNKYGNLTLA